MKLNFIFGIILIKFSVIYAELVHIGTYYAKDLDDAHYYEKSYFIPQHVRSNWVGGMRFCESFGYQLATFENLGELNSILKAKSEKSHLFTRYTLIGGVTKHLMSTQDWFWIYDKQKIAYKMIWEAGEPNGDKGEGFCLSFGPTQSAMKFNDIACNRAYSYSFICMKIKKF